ncbi:MAG: alcohol dehydrogenase catalytic domain-containing protein [Acidimicrobiia bacterium]|nr:alcohol dehydrogenase catalytic domain-containing protein [Acidimicrobiia bacterium]
MRAVRCPEGIPTVVDVPEPTGDGVLVTVASAGICGSDLHLLSFSLPATFGHEFAGTLADGTPVAVEPIDPCHVCDACIDGNTQLCVRGPSMAFGVGRDGGMAEKVLVPTSSIARLPVGVEASNGCLVEPLAVAVHGVRRGNIRGSHRVAVIGGGTIGQTALVVAQQTGAKVDLSARHERQIEAATRLGAGSLDGNGYDVVIEAAGTASALAEAADRCRPGGTIVLLGSYWDGTVEMPGMAIGMKELTLVPAVMYGRSGPSRDVDVAATILAQRPELSDIIVTHRFPLDAAAEAFVVAADRSAGAIKVVLEP